MRKEIIQLERPALGAGGAIGSLGSQRVRNGDDGAADRLGRRGGGPERGLSRRLQFGAARVVAGTAAAFLLLGLGATVTLPPTRRKTSKVRGPRRALPPPDDVLSEEPAELDNPAGLAARFGGRRVMV